MPFLKKVVVVEDEDAVAHLIEATLGDAGYLCLRARDGQEALRLAVREAPDLIILDVLMPRLDGMEVVRRLKGDAVQSRIPVLMLTALSGVDDRVRGLQAGADDYLGKPFDVRELLARSQALVRHNRRERDRSPTTELPGPGALDDALADWLERAPFALLFVVLAGFDRFVDENGWLRGEHALKQVAEGLRAATEQVADARLMHLGGDDFVVLAPADAAAQLAASLEAVGGHRARAEGQPALAVEVTTVDVTGARSTEEVARAVSRARAGLSRR